MWEFAIGLILLELRPGSLALVSAFGLVDSGAQVIAGPHIGAYIDRSDSHMKLSYIVWGLASFGICASVFRV